MKKLLTIILVTILCVSLGSCGDKSQNTKAKTNKFKASPEILSTDIFGKAIQVGNKVLSLPLTYDSLIEADASLDTTVSPDYVMDKGAEKIENFNIGDTVFQVDFKNNSEKRSTLKESDIEYIFATKGKDVFYQKGVNVGTTLTQLTNKWGEPTIDMTQQTDDVMTFIYLEYPIKSEMVHNSIGFGSVPKMLSATGNQYTVKVDKNTSKVTNIQYRWNLCKDTRLFEKKEDISFGENNYVLSYKFPENIHKNQITVGGKGMTVFNIDEHPYVVVIDSYLPGMGGIKEISEESLSSQINIFADKKYEIEIYELKNDTARAAGYLNNKDSMECAVVYIKGAHSYKAFESKLISLDDSELSTDAIKMFKDIIKAFVLSIEEVPAN